MNGNGMNDNGGNHDADLATLIGLAGSRRPVEAERAERVRHAVELEWMDTVDGRRSRRARWTLAAAAVAVASLTAVVSTRTTFFVEPVPVGVVELVRGSLTVDGIGTAENGVSLIAKRTIETDGSSLASIRLLGGASLRMDRSSRIAFETPHRIRLDSGALYVDSPAEARGDPLEIVVGDIAVREIGTQFETRLTTGATIVRVREGRVVVTARERIEAAAGVEIALTPSGDITRRDVDPWDPEWGWTLETAPAFDAEGRSIGEFLRWASRETGLALETASVDREFLSSTRLHGTIDGLTPHEAIEAVLPATGLDADVSGGTLTVRPLVNP